MFEGPFHSVKLFTLNFQLLSNKWESIFCLTESIRKENSLVVIYTYIFDNIFLKVSVPFEFGVGPDTFRLKSGLN